MIQYFIHIVLFIFLIQKSSSAQNGIQNLGGATTNGIAHAGVTLDNISAMYTNQAGTAFLEGWAVDVSVDRRFNLEELTTFSFAAATSLNFGTVGILVGQYGFDAYSEQKIGLSYARLLTSYLAISGQFDVLGFKIDGFGNNYSYTVEVGLYSKLSDQVHLAAHIFNPTSSKLSDEEELDSRIKIGVRYIPSNKVDFFTEIEKIIDRSVQIKLGAEYAVLDNLDLMAGANLEIKSFHFGFKYLVQNKITLVAAFSFNNNQLGNSPGISAQYWNRPLED
ncbi:MAG: hypothetical protein QNL00_05500 [Saprospiraceae bacterium]|tara:strand:+ start:948 stop:1781 length:834 start_codon:yes stop_codon:yes gene_type:complete